MFVLHPKDAERKECGRGPQHIKADCFAQDIGNHTQKKLFTNLSEHTVLYGE